MEQQFLNVQIFYKMKEHSRVLGDSLAAEVFAVYTTGLEIWSPEATLLLSGYGSLL